MGLWDFIFSSVYMRARVYMGIKITAPYNGVVSFILNNLNNRRKFGRASDRGCEAD